jgi:hypothetical protein
MRFAEGIIDEQLAYYNAHDLEGFASLYHDEIEAYAFESQEVLFSGIEALKTRYSQRFENKDLSVHIKQRMVLGQKVIDFEMVSGLEPGIVKEVIVTYLIEDEKIRRVWFMYP